MRTRTMGLLLMALAVSTSAQAKLKALIVDGQNNHAGWPRQTVMMKQYLEDTGLFEVEVERTCFTWRGEREKAFLPLAGAGNFEDLPEPKQDPHFNPSFEDYDVVVCNFGNNAADWPAATQRRFERYMESGGGLVVTHAADNAFGNWDEYNRMIGLGGWGGRNAETGPYVYYTNEGKLVRDPSPGGCGSHGPQHNVPVTLRVKDHPITAGMPEKWLTARDECYAKMRGPAEDMTILATGKDMSGKAPTDRHEPALMVIDYGEGRVFHTIFGHDHYSSEGVGFIVSLTRGAEWAASGEVTQPIPDDFPTAERPSSRDFVLRRQP